MAGMLVLFHTPSNEGYAMATLERVFFAVACELVGGQGNVHFAFKDLSRGMPVSLPENFGNVLALDASKAGQPCWHEAAKYIKRSNIETALSFDLSPSSPLCGMLRKAGVKHLVSYWGASMSSENVGLKLLLKRAEIALRSNKPDLFIFESEAMRFLAVQGRGISRAHTAVIPTGVNTELFRPNEHGRRYVTEQFGIAEDRFVVIFSGHMEERKGVRVIMEAARKVVDESGRDDICFLICGNRPGEEKRFVEMLVGSRAMSNVIFAGYRRDLRDILPGCDMGVIASTGWDSFTISSLEMAACGLPLVASALQGLVETLEDGRTGYLFEPGNSTALAERILQLSSDPALRGRLAAAGRQRIVDGYSRERQQARLIECISSVISRQ